MNTKSQTLYKEGIKMTKKERNDFNKMHRALSRIKMYQSSNSLRRDSKKDWGLDYEESLEMAYENVLSEAKEGLQGVRKLKEPEGKP